MASAVWSGLRQVATFMLSNLSHTSRATICAPASSRGGRSPAKASSIMRYSVGSVLTNPASGVRSGACRPMSVKPSPVSASATASLGRGVILSMTEIGKATLDGSSIQAGNPSSALPARAQPRAIVVTESRSLSPLWLKLSQLRRVIGAPPAS